ncbi:hypothetical protein [Ideonella dechloratans]|uniref:hypothetical protein n=1 Tax=Ideonella dechloratans TaxID=36863 RepID=UPI0035AED864
MTSSAPSPLRPNGMRWLAAGSLVLTLSVPVPSLAQAGSVYYVCPGNVFTNTLSAKEAAQKGCKAKEATEPTTISGPKPRTASAAPASGAGAESRVDRNEQKARDSDAKRILSDELSKAQGELDALKKEYNNGQPERRGDERNYQKYLDRTADLKASIARKEADVAAIKRELGKLD